MKKGDAWEIYFHTVLQLCRAREQLPGYLAEKKNEHVEEKKSLFSYTVAWLHVAQPQNCIKLPMDHFLNLSFLVFVLSIVHLQFYINS